MNFAICDDNKEIVDQLTLYLVNYFESRNAPIPEIHRFTNGYELLSSNINNLDIVFLDIKMPEIDGITIGRKLKENNHNIIIFIITSFNEYLDDAMRFHVFRYLSKPIDKNRLYNNLSEALSCYYNKTYKVIIETKNENIICSSSNIIMVEALKKKVYIHTTTACFECSQSLSYWTKELVNPPFVRTHRSYIVNMEYISNFNHSIINIDTYKLRAYITKRKYTAFKTTYLLYLNSTK